MDLRNVQLTISMVVIIFVVEKATSTQTTTFPLISQKPYCGRKYPGIKVSFNQSFHLIGRSAEVRGYRPGYMCWLKLTALHPLYFTVKPGSWRAGNQGSKGRELNDRQGIGSCLNRLQIIDDKLRVIREFTCTSDMTKFYSFTHLSTELQVRFFYESTSPKGHDLHRTGHDIGWFNFDLNITTSHSAPSLLTLPFRKPMEDKPPEAMATGTGQDNSSLSGPRPFAATAITAATAVIALLILIGTITMVTHRRRQRRRQNPANPSPPRYDEQLQTAYPIPHMTDEAPPPRYDESNVDSFTRSCNPLNILSRIMERMRRRQSSRPSRTSNVFCLDLYSRSQLGWPHPPPYVASNEECGNYLPPASWRSTPAADSMYNGLRSRSDVSIHQQTLAYPQEPPPPYEHHSPGPVATVYM